MKVIDPGHVYELEQLGGGSQTLSFLKRSSGFMTYDEEFPGIQTQELLRVVIDRTKYLNDVRPCDETENAIYEARMALYWYEVRAWRRKQEKANRKGFDHESDVRSRAWRMFPDEVPFTEHEIELLPTGADGHIILDDRQASLF